FHMVTVFMIEQASQKLLINIRMSIFNNLQHKEMAGCDRVRPGDIITRVTGDLDYLRHFVAYVIYVILGAVVMTVASLVLLFSASWQLTLAFLALVPLPVPVSMLYNKKIKPLYRNNREMLSRLNTQASENIDGNRVVKAFSREEFEKEKFDRASGAYRDAQLKAAMANLKFGPLMSFFSQSLTVIAILLGGYLCIKGKMTVGELSMFVSLEGTLAAIIVSIPNHINELTQFHVSAMKVVQICEASPLIADRDNALALEPGQRLKGDITFDHVSFRYKKGGIVLDDVSFSIKAGETVAIMGPTGCGKTTLINLLVRFYDVTSGKVLLDGVDVRDLRLRDIHRSIGIATQDVFLFSDTVDSNIAFFDVNQSEEKVVEYATLAAADGFIRKMPQGYETIVGERGVGLSGGQRQRVALARALAAEPSVLVLDDTTSAVDMDTEKYIQSSLANLPFECTKIIVAQRISSVRHADKIIIMQDKKITVGTHDSLAQSCAYYRELCELQDVANLPAFTGEVNFCDPQPV
ncbi:MAG: ABC transporter ATP-binding protein, partial [Clostridia bacterium]|nr:ABC transporter ATP-binding protein [Clostridia bacterium]